MIVIKAWSKKVLLVIGGVFLSLAGFGNGGNGSYYGFKRSIFVHIRIKENKAFVEYCYPDFMGMSNTKFDTLNLDKNAYKGRFFSIKPVKNALIFSPGNIELKSGEPDNSFNRKRNLGYLQFASREFKKRLKWTGEKLDELEPAGWASSSIVQLPANEFKARIDNVSDTLFRYYAYVYCHAFHKITIRDNRVVPRKYLESIDTAKIYWIWSLLSKGAPKQRSLIPYLIQFPVPILGLAGLNVNPLFLAAPVVYPATYLVLIGSEKLVVNRVSARSTYKITFSGTNGSRTIKIRNSKIIRNDFNYLLPFDFEKSVLEDTNNKML